MSLDGDATVRHDPSPAQQWNTALEMTPDHASWRRISKNKRNLGSCSAKNTAANASRIAQDRQAWTESVAGQCDARMQEEKVWLQGKRWKEEAARRREKRQAASDKRRYTHFWRHLKPHMGPPLTWFSSCFSWAPHRRNSVCDILTQLPCDIYSAILHALSSLRHLLYPLWFAYQLSYQTSPLSSQIKRSGYTYASISFQESSARTEGL